MDQLDAITLLYLSKHWDGNGSLLDCVHTFQETKKEISKAIHAETSEIITRRLDSGEPLF